MAGEMTHVDPTAWPIHKAVADALGSRLRPFDQYQGPCITWKGKRLFIHHPEKIWRALILGEGWVYGFDDAECATEQVEDALRQHGVSHPNPSDFVQADDVADYLMATDDISHLSTPTYANTRDVARYLVEAIKGMEPSHV